MLKNMAIKKLTIIFISLIIMLIIYLFPTTENNNYNIKSTTIYSTIPTKPIYLVDNNNLISRFDILKNNDNTNDLIKEVINDLTIGTNSNHIPNNFKKIIPEGTKIIDFSIDNNLLKINFTKELFNVNENDSEKMIESILYSLTEIDNIDKIMIFVENESLLKIPNTNKTLPNILDRSYGINKIYDISNTKNVSKITTYYVNKLDNISYYTPVTYISNKNNEKIEIIIEQLKSSPTYQTNLVSYLASSTELLSYEILENSVNLSFNNEIMSLNENNIVEEVKYSISLSVRDTYNINETIFYVDNNLIDALFL